MNDNSQYRGKSKSVTLLLSNMLYRDTTAKTIASYDIYVCESRNFIHDTEIENQKRRTTGWKLTLNHRQYIGPAVLNLEATYQHGTHWFGTLPAFEEYSTTKLTKLCHRTSKNHSIFSIS
ncbi:MAG TPA: ShlB/FhaC/HecB family hemolysin secretion/activation protein [Arsenophonus sp.]